MVDRSDLSVERIARLYSSILTETELGVLPHTYRLFRCPKGLKDEI